MTIFKATAEDLAKILARNPLLYNAGVEFFNGIKYNYIFTDEVERDLKKDIDLFAKAHHISTSSDWFAFKVHDSWAENHEGNSEGVELYQKIESELIRKLGLHTYGAPSVNDAIEVLKKKEIKRVYTLTPDYKLGYCSVPYIYEVDDGDMVQRESLDSSAIEDFKTSGIEVIVLKQ